MSRWQACTPEWFTMFGEVLVGLAREHEIGQSRISLSEVYRDVPREVAGHDGPVGWSVVANGGRVDYAPSPDADADIVLEVDYSFLCETLQEYDPSDDTVERERTAAIAAAAAAGRFHVRGELRRSPALLAKLHDAIAARTVQSGTVRDR